MRHSALHLQLSSQKARNQVYLPAPSTLEDLFLVKLKVQRKQKMMESPKKNGQVPVQLS